MNAACCSWKNLACASSVDRLGFPASGAGVPPGAADLQAPAVGRGPLEVAEGWVPAGAVGRVPQEVYPQPEDAFVEELAEPPVVWRGMEYDCELVEEGVLVR